MIDISHHNNPNYFLTINDVKDFENNYTIPENCLVLAYTGWSQYWSEPEKYRNVDTNGNMAFPGFSVGAIEYLLTKNIVGIGIDTLSPDGGNMLFPVHKKILGQNKYIIENLCNLDQLPVTGFKIIALPIKIANGSEAPCRVIATINN